MASPAPTLQEYIYGRLKRYLDSTNRKKDEGEGEHEGGGWTETVNLAHIAGSIAFLIYCHYGFGFNDTSKVFVIATDSTDTNGRIAKYDEQEFRIAIFVSPKPDQFDLLVDANSATLNSNDEYNLSDWLNYEVDKRINAIIAMKRKQGSNGTSNPEPPKRPKTEQESTANSGAAAVRKP